MAASLNPFFIRAWVQTQASAAGKFDLQRPEHLLDHCVWTPRSWEHIQPREEAAAIDTGLKNHSITLSEAIRRQGRDPQEHFDELSRDKAQLEELGISVPGSAS